MNKRLILTFGIVTLLVVLGIVFAVVSAKQPDNTLPTTAAQAKAMKSSNLTACRTDRTKQINLPPETQQQMEMTAIGQLMDVPAGTNVDVYLASYNPTKMVGSDLYASGYGDYNFTATRASGSADWKMTEFVKCAR